jgi:ornithine cyclodeaminase/alanine dehydrogenase-like protein (mu-crystallin family)
MGREVLILREADVRAALDMPSLIDAVERAFVAYSSGRAEVPGVIHLDVPESGGEVHVKAGHLHGEPFYAVKVSSGFAPPDGPPAADGLVMAFDARNGAPVAFLLDNGFITDARTGAAGGVAARHLAPSSIEVVAVIGTGAQVPYQLDALACVRGFGELRVWGRDPDRARGCADDLASRPGLPERCTYAVASSVQGAVDGADVVITCTASREPLVRAEWLSPGAHVTAVGSDAPDKQELETEVLARADVLVVDGRAQCTQIGELHHALEAGAIASADHAAELGEVAAGLKPGRTSEDQLTVCDLTGLGVQDVAAAALALARAGDSGDTIERLRT